MLFHAIALPLLTPDYIRRKIWQQYIYSEQYQLV
jgi:hypothetical protein